jgi:glucose/arabinose dehydrogenase
MFCLTRFVVPLRDKKSVRFFALILCWALGSFGGDVPKGETERSSAPEAVDSRFVVDVVYEGLDLPASLEFAPDGKLLILERGFTFEKTTFDPLVSILDLTTKRQQVLVGTIPATSYFDDESGNQGGAVGMALDPQFSSNQRLYVCYHHRTSRGVRKNRLSSFTVKDGRLESETIVLELPGDLVHNGCRVAIDDQGLLYLTTGSIEPFGDALDLKQLTGKILRLTPAGKVPVGNPFPNSFVWSYGHRNPQGLALDPETKTIWSTEHGENSADELNVIEPGANYGWPACRGAAALGETFVVEEYWSDRLEIKDGRATCRLQEPHASRYRPAFRTYYADSTVGISDLVVYRGRAFPAWAGNLLVTMLKGRKLVRVVAKDGKFEKEETLINQQYGRLRDVTVGSDGFLYILTNEPASENLWRGHSRLLRLRPAP